jgi:choline dehydrogenase-like flavoprotein
MGSPDIVIIGSGMGGATIAAGLAGNGAKVTILEKGERLLDSPETRDARAIFQRGHFRPKEMWLDAEGKPFNPGNYHVVGGNTKFYGAVLFRYRRQDFSELEFPGGGVSPAWPFPYEELEPWYSKAEQLYQVRGTTAEDPTEPFHSSDYPYKPVPDEPAIAKVRERLKSVGLHPASLPLGVDIDRWLARAKTPFDAYPDTLTGKMDAESCGLAAALKDPDIDLQTGADVVRLETDENNRIASIVYRQKGEQKRLSPKLVILSAAVDPRTVNDSVYQKTIHFNDFYFDDGNGSGPLGQVQLLGRVTGQILKSRLSAVPEFALNMLSRRSVDWYLVSEDLPRKESRVRLDGSQVILEWRFSNMKAHETLVARVKERMRAAGYPILPSQLVDGRLPSHQCGTTRIGNDPAGYVCDPWCRSFDHRNLFIVDAGFLPTSAAVNPSLTVAAQSLRVADYIRRTELA